MVRSRPTKWPLYSTDSHPNRLGPVDALPFFARQQRFTFARCGITDPLSLDDYAAHGGWVGLDAARALSPQAVVDAVKASGLRGRGGAGFPTGIKWQTVLDTPSDEKFIVCNADEGDSGTFADRMLMEGDPFCLIEGMAIAAHAVGAQHGFIYIRSEYPFAIRTMERAIALAAAKIAPFTLEVRVGAGAYVCGEETALLESIEGKRGQVRAKPPLPAISGLFGKPTVINNVLSLAAVPFILAQGAEAYAAVGFGKIARDHADPACGQYPQRRTVRGGLWHHAGRVGERHWRWHRERATGARGTGRRAVGGLYTALAIRSAL